MRSNKLLLISGGMDSLALAYWIRPRAAITIDYGQRAAAAEVEISAHICSELAIEHKVLYIDCGSIAAGCMGDNEGDSCRAAPTAEWWPFRNQLLITFAAAHSVLHGFPALIIGTVATDRRHQDGTAQFVGRMAALLEFQEGGLTLEAPAIRLSSEELVRRSRIPASMLAWAHSCHTSNIACGSCPGCVKQTETWKALSATEDRANARDKRDGG